MNRNPSGSLVLSKALIGYLYFKTAEGLSHRSLESYERILKKWIEYCGDVEIKSIASKDIIQYLSWLRSEYVPQRLNGGQYVFHSTERWCMDAGYSHTLYGKTIQEKLCYQEDSFAGQLTSCEPALEELFETILLNLAQADLGLGDGHLVRLIFAI